MKEKRIQTSNREIYEKFNMLKFSPEVIIHKDSINSGPNTSNWLNKMVNSINQKQQVLKVENVGDYFVVKKMNPVTFNVYFQKKKK